MTEPGSALDRIRAEVASLPGIQFGEGEQLTVLLGDGEHRLALSVATAPSGSRGMGAACSCGSWEAAMFGASRWILERIAESWREHLHLASLGG